MKTEKVSKLYRKIHSDIMAQDDDELMATDSYKELLSSMIHSMLETNNKIDIEFINKYNNVSAYTNGEEITSNVFSPLVLKKKTRYDRYLVNIGQVVHECGHVLYTNFDLLNKIRENISNYNFDKLRKFGYGIALSKEHILRKKIFASSMNDFVNIIEDGYIEAALKAEYPETGLVHVSLNETQNTNFSFSEGKIMQRVIDSMTGQLPVPMLFNVLMHMKHVMHKTPTDWDDALKMPVIEYLLPYIEKADKLFNDYIYLGGDQEKIIGEYANIIYELLPTTVDEEGSDDDKTTSSDGDKMKNDEESDSGKAGSSDETSSFDSSEDSSESESSGDSDTNPGKKSSGSSKAKEKKSASSFDNSISGEMNSADIDKMSEKIKSEYGMSEEAVGKGKNKKESKATTEDKEKSEEKEKTEETKKRLEDALNKAISSKALEKVLSDAQSKELAESVKKISNDFSNRHFTSLLIRNVAEDKTEIMEYCKTEYNKIMKKVAPISNQCVRKISQILKKRDDEEFDNGYMSGNVFNATEVWRNDGKYFSKRVLPDETPDVAFSILVDESGSMAIGERCVRARECAILFDDMARKLKIPTRITGHTFYMRFKELALNKYVDFVSNDKEKYSLVNIDYDYDNADSIALSAIAENLLERPEKNKVLIVISDGEPAPGPINGKTDNWRGVKYREGLRLDLAEVNAVARYYRKKGLVIIGIAINCADSIKKIYEEGFLDCTDLNKLPNELLKIFKKYVLK